MALDTEILTTIHIILIVHMPATVLASDIHGGTHTMADTVTLPKSLSSRMAHVTALFMASVLLAAAR
jgi:hypothetical protein